MRENTNNRRDDRRGGDERYEAPAKPKVHIPIIALPTAKVPVSTTLASRIQLWHGDPKIGKTVTASRARGGTFFLKFEPGHDHIEHFGNVVNRWEELIGNIDALENARREREALPFANVCVDTAGMAFVRCTEFILAQLGVDHESDAAWGKGSAMIEREFRRQITRLCNLGFGVILIAHSAERTYTNGKTGNAKREWTKRVVDLPKKAESVVPPLADMILYFTKEYNEARDEWTRVIKTQRTDAYDAGIRYPDGWAPMPETLPMSWSALEEAWSGGAPGEEARRAEEARTVRERTEAAREKLKAFAGLMGADTCRAVIGRSTQGMSADELEAAVAKLEAAQAKAVQTKRVVEDAIGAAVEAKIGAEPKPESKPPLRVVEPAAKAEPAKTKRGAKPPVDTNPDRPSDSEWTEFWARVQQIDAEHASAMTQDEHREEMQRVFGLRSTQDATRTHLRKYLGFLDAGEALEVTPEEEQARDAFMASRQAAGADADVPW